MIKAITTKPLDGDPEGTEREFDQADFDRLKGFGAVRAIDTIDIADTTNGDEKAAAPVANKAALPVANKAALKPSDKAS